MRLTVTIWSSRFAIVSAVLLAGTASAQTQPNPDLKSTYGSVTLKAGFLPDPFKKKLVAGGPIRTNFGEVNAYVAKASDFDLSYTKGNYPLTIHVESSADTTLLINLPNGKWIANDDGGKGLNPLIRMEKPLSGRYDIWVGTYGKGTPSAVLHITERNVDTKKSGHKKGSCRRTRHRRQDGIRRPTRLA